MSQFSVLVEQNKFELSLTVLFATKGKRNSSTKPLLNSSVNCQKKPKSVTSQMKALDEYCLYYLLKDVNFLAMFGFILDRKT